jgi:hypothetical protein
MASKVCPSRVERTSWWIKLQSNIVEPAFHPPIGTGEIGPEFTVHHRLTLVPVHPDAVSSHVIKNEDNVLAIPHFISSYCSPLIMYGFQIEEPGYVHDPGFAAWQLDCFDIVFEAPSAAESDVTIDLEIETVAASIRSHETIPTSVETSNSDADHESWMESISDDMVECRGLPDQVKGLTYPSLIGLLVMFLNSFLFDNAMKNVGIASEVANTSTFEVGR